MLTAVLRPPLEADLLASPAAHDWDETQPAYWRSEAFAEDVADLPPPVSALHARPATPSRPLLRRALAVVLRR
jgi:hypothetical protein